jgi:para-nitrobenzyl esterase
MYSKLKQLIKTAAVVFFCEFAFCEILQIEDGKIEGTLMEDRLKEKFHAFLQIPFAEPPVNDLRFKAPLIKQPWENVLNCMVYGPMCAQPNLWNNSLISEDCLHLNVYSKTIPSSDASVKLKPVIAFIHGGGFETGLK